MAPYCKNYDGIEAFAEVLRILIDGIKLQNLQFSEERPYFSFTSHLLASYNLESYNCMDEPGKIIMTDVENLKVADTFERKCEIEEFSSSECIATEKLQLLHSLIKNQEFKFIENASLDFSPSIGDPSFAIFVNNQKRGVAEVSDVRTILTGYELKVEDYVHPTELSLFSKHRDSTELSLALSYRRLLSCCQGVRIGNPIFSDQIEEDGWSTEILGTLGLVVEIQTAESETPRQAIITAAHNCRRNFEKVYGFVCGRGTQENYNCNPAHDVVVSMLPIGSSCSIDANSVDGKYANATETTSITGSIIQISPLPPPQQTEQIFFRGAVHKAVGKYIKGIVYKQMDCYLCQFSAGDHGDSGACVFYQLNATEYIAFGILTAKIDDQYVVTPLSVIAKSTFPSISLAGRLSMQVCVSPTRASYSLGY